MATWWLQVAGSDRSSIILPLSGLKQFHEMVGHFVEITKDRIEGMTGANVRTVDPPQRWTMSGEGGGVMVKRDLQFQILKVVLVLHIGVWLGVQLCLFVLSSSLASPIQVRPKIILISVYEPRKFQGICQSNRKTDQKSCNSVWSGDLL